jgi:hypothetical protein
MKTKILIAAAALFSILNPQPATLQAQGSLTPPSAPAPTMKTLAQIEPRTSISSLPFTINTPGSYCVLSNLTGIAGTNGISVTASDVSIDLGGFALIGVPGAMDGINCTGDRLVVFNGTIRNWSSNGVNVSITTRDDHFNNLIAFGNGLGGIAGGGGALVEDCVVDGNGGLGVQVGAGSIVRGCAIKNNTGGGFNHFSINNEKQGVLLSGCNFANNGGTAITLNVGCFATGNNIVGHSVAGMFVTGQGNRVEANHFNGNNIALEMGSGSSSNLVVRNSFQANTNAFVAGGVNQAIGPFIGSSSLATNTNPHANYSF